MGFLHYGLMLVFVLTCLISCQLGEEVDVGSLLFGVSDKPNSGDVSTSQQESLGTISIENTPGADTVITNSMLDMKKRVDQAMKNISELQKQLDNYTPSVNEASSSTSLTDLSSQVDSVASSSSKVQEKLSALKNRLENMKQTTSAGSSVGEASSQSDQLMAETERKKNHLSNQVPVLSQNVEAAINDLTNDHSDLDHLHVLAQAAAEVDNRDYYELVDSMEQTVIDTGKSIDYMPARMDFHCEILDRQIIQIQGTNAVTQGEKSLLKYPFASAKAKSESPNGEARKVIDGGTSAHFYSPPYSCQQTPYTDKPWLLLKLEAMTTIVGVRVLARGDCCCHLSRGVLIHTNQYNPDWYPYKNELCTNITEHLNAGAYTTLLCSYHRKAQYIKFTKETYTQLSFCEVEALGLPLYSYQYGQPAMQSSTFSSKTPAHLATDNDKTTCSRTLTRLEGGDPWWQVDLGTMQYVGRVTLTFKEAEDGRQNIEVYVYTEFPVTCERNYANLCGGTNSVAGYNNVYDIFCSRLFSARYIRVFKMGTQSSDYLELCDVEAKSY